MARHRFVTADREEISRYNKAVPGHRTPKEGFDQVLLPATIALLALDSELFVSE
jgi:hypothetical protein